MAFIHPNFSDGGVERTNIGLAIELIQRDYTVKFLTTSFTSHFLDELDSVGIDLIALGPKPMRRAIFGIADNLVNIASEAQYVHVISCQYYVNVLMPLVTALVRRHVRNVSFVFSERNHILDLDLNGRKRDKIIKALLPLSYRFADKVIANAEETAVDLAHIIGRPVQTVYNPTVSHRLDEMGCEAVTEAWFLDDDRPAIIAVGRMTFQKGFDLLLDAFSLLRESVDCRLVIIGDGPERLALARQSEALGISSALKMPGFVSNPYKFMKASRVFVLSSRYEGLPNVLIEAAYLGTPCVAFACKSGPREVLLNGDAGILVPQGDVHALAHGMRRLLSDSAAHLAMMDAARKSALRFNRRSAADALEDVLLSSSHANRRLGRATRQDL